MEVIPDPVRSHEPGPDPDRIHEPGPGSGPARQDQVQIQGIGLRPIAVPICSYQKEVHLFYILE